MQRPALVRKEEYVPLFQQLTLKPFSLAMFLCVILVPQLESSQDLQAWKAGVVRIHNTELEGEGTGFIVQIDKDRAYIITAAHVVKSDQHPSVYFFNRPNDSFQADLINREDDDQKGLALLVVRVNKEAVKGLVSLKLGNPRVRGGEVVNVIGFPDGTTFWSVTAAHVSRVEGRNLVFSEPIKGGNSGGPVLLNGQVIGLVTDTLQESAFAIRAENIPIYISGIIPSLVGLNASMTAATGDGAKNDEFCGVLNAWIVASKDRFYPIIGKPTNSENTFEPNVMIPGASGGYVLPRERVYNYLLIDKDKSKVESQYYSVVSRVKACLPKWKEKEDTSSSDRFHKYRERKGSTIVVVYYNRAAQDGNYYLVLSVDIPGPRSMEW